MFKYFLYKIGLFLLRRLPPKLSYKLAGFVSDLQYFVSFRDRRAVKNNLKAILSSEDDVSSVARKVFRNFGRYLIEFFQMKEMVDERFIRNNVRTEGINHLDEVLAQGKGAIVVTAHIGNWELGGVLLSVMKYPLMAIALPHRERPVNDLFNYQREVKGIKIVPVKGALRQCIEQLASNKLVALVADRDFTTSGMVIDFLGGKMLVPKGPAILSWRTGAPIMPMFLIRNGDKAFTFFCSDPIYPPERKGDMADDETLKGIIQRYMSVVEEKIRLYPSQWLLFREFNVK